MIQKIITLVLLALCAQGGFAQAQSWQWGRPISFDSTGIQSPFPAYYYSTGLSLSRTLVANATDEAGNLYTLYHVGKVNLKVAGLPDTGYGKHDILLTSFNCDGQYRWSKVIGSSTDSDVAFSLKASAESGVFVMGLLNMSAPGGVHFNRDTTIANTNKTMFIAKYDTSGKFQWVHLPQPDTISSYCAWKLSIPYDMDLGSDGNLYLLARLNQGSYEGGRYIVGSLSYHILKYNSSGQFLGGISLPINTLSGTPNPLLAFSGAIRYDGTNNRFTIVGMVGDLGLDVGGNILGLHSSYVASFNASTGALIWLKASNPVRLTPALSSQLFINFSIGLDALGNLYVSGPCQDSAYFNGVLFRNPWHSQSNFVMKMDANTGQALWTTIGGYGQNNYSAIYSLALTGQKLAVTGTYQDSLIFPNALLTNTPSDSSDAFIVQLDALSGKVQKMASLSGRSLSQGALIAADRRGNFYVTGSYALQGQAIGPDALSINNYYNLFIAKWGWANCTCTPPVASLVHSASANLAQAYTYTGTTAGLDSLVWDFGDGTTQKLTSGFGNAVLHNFPANGHYTVCLTAYNESCGGSSTACIPLALAVGTTVLLGNIRVYPNPAAQELNIEGAARSEATVWDGMGRPLLRQFIPGDKQVLELGSLPAGIYLLRLSDSEGHSQNFKFSKL